MATKTKIWLLTAAALILIGGLIFVGVMTALKWDFTKLSTARYVTKDYEITEEFTGVSVESTAAKIQILPSEDETTRVTCLEAEHTPYTVCVRDGILKIEEQNHKKWYQDIGINFGSPKVTVYLSNAVYAELTVKNTTGAVSVQNISAENMTVTVSTGHVTITEVRCPDTLRIRVTTGDTTLKNVQCGNLWSDGNTGHLTMEQVEATWKLFAERTTGNVQFSRCDARQISISSTTGDVSGSWLTPKSYEVRTTTGKVSVPKTDGCVTDTNGSCAVKTTTGNITITE